MNQLLRRYWRELLMLLLIVLPFVTLIIAGTLSLLHSPWFLQVFGLMALSGITAAWLAYSIRQASREQLDTLPNPEGAWTPAEDGTWKAVQALAIKAQTAPPKDAIELQALATEVINTVAGNLHTDAKFAWARFTVPELLLAVEQASQHLRTTLHKRVPGSQALTASHVMWAHHLYTAHRTKIQLAFWAHRMFRLVNSPFTALVQEFKDHFTGKAMQDSFNVAHGWMARLLTEELGRSAINLYSGRMKRSTEHAILALRDAAPPETGPVPVRILVAGQTNAGKSSLINALLGSIKAQVSELPTPGRMKEYRFKGDGKLDLTIIDTPGQSSTEIADKALIDACCNVDLIVWVAKATQPARQVDVIALQAIRNWFGQNPDVIPPTIVMAVTHIDQLKPFREWTPPYNIANPQRDKAYQIREAVLDIGKVLSAPEEALVPVSLMENEPPYNLDALWAVIAKQMNSASQAALARSLKQGNPLRLSEILGQCYEGGKFLLNKI